MIPSSYKSNLSPRNGRNTFVIPKCKLNTFSSPVVPFSQFRTQKSIYSSCKFQPQQRNFSLDYILSMCSKLGIDAKELQKQNEKIKQNNEKVFFNGVAGGGLVKITLNGNFKMTTVKIDEKLMAGKPEVIEELFTHAYNLALDKAKEKSSEDMLSMAKNVAPFPFPFPK